MRDFHIRRTLLMTPGNRPERLEKARLYPADVLVFDLEDSVPPLQKAYARNAVAAALRNIPQEDRREYCVRINGSDTAFWEEDLAILPYERVDSIMVPKVESAQQLLHIEQYLASLGCDARRTRKVELIVMLETPRGILNALTIADAADRSSALFFGSGDYTSATGACLSESVLSYPRSIVAAAAGATGLQAIDAAFFADVKNADATRVDAEAARDFGFVGKVVFHPNQIDVVNDVFTPTPKQIERAKLIVSAYSDSVNRGEGTAVASGVFIAVDLLAPAERILKLAEMLQDRALT